MFSLCILITTNGVYSVENDENNIKDAINKGKAGELSQEVEVQGNEDILAKFFGL